MELLTAIAVMLVGIMIYCRQRGDGAERFAFAVPGDEDIKIAPGSFSRGSGDISEAEAAAQAYLRQKSVGNVDKARVLGERFAQLLRELAESYLASDPQGLEKARAHHKILMLSYVVNRVIAERSPNSILAQTALNVFYDTVEEKTPSLNPHIRDMAGFSLYILCERSDTCMEGEVGKIFAQLCGKEGDAALIAEGNKLYQDYHLECSRLHEETQYVSV